VFEGRGLSTGGPLPLQLRAALAGPGAKRFTASAGCATLRAADTALARANAKALVGDFLAKAGPQRIARQTPVVARRLSRS
jgi:hypothetical protein